MNYEKKQIENTKKRETRKNKAYETIEDFLTTGGVALIVAIIISTIIFAVSAWIKLMYVDLKNYDQNFNSISNNVDETIRLTAQTTNNGDSKQIVASIYPSDDVDKTVVWGVAWEDSAKTDVISNFITISTSSDTLIATVTCHSPFTGNIIITATRHSGGHKATCIVKYVGLPTNLAVVPQDINASSSGTIGSYYAMEQYQDYIFNIKATNAFGNAPAPCEYEYELSAVGSINVQNCDINKNTSEKTWTGSVTKVNLSEIFDKSTPFNNNPGFLKLQMQSDSSINVHVYSCPSLYIQDSTAGSSSVQHLVNAFKSFVDDNWYILLTVREKNTGLTSSIKIRPVELGSQLALDTPEIVF